MKKRLLPITLAIMLLMTFIPFGPAALAESFEATLMGQLDSDVSDAVPEWGIGDIPEATVAFEKFVPATISMEFSEPIKFTGNWTGISTNVPVDDDAHAQAIGGQILSFIVDGEDLGAKIVPLINRDDAGYLTIDIARQWGGDYDAYDLAGMDPFSTLEITFVIGHQATLMGQLDTDVSDSIPEWGFGDIPEATAYFSVGEPATISMEFSTPIKFTGNWTGIATSIPVSSDEDAETSGARITSFKVDGNELGSRPVPLINRDDAGFMTIDIARQWGGNYDAYGLADMDPFSSLEITFIVEEMPVGEESDTVVSGDFAMAGNAWIGGTFLTDEGEFDWIPFEDQQTPFEIGVPFTVTLDLGSETQTHGEADWGFICVVQTDIMDSHLFYDAFIEKILVDGREIFFVPGNIEIGSDNGVRISLTNGWTDDPVVEGPRDIGTFSKLEVVMVFTQADAENPFGNITEEPEPLPPPPPIERPDPTPPPAASNDGGLPGWVIPVIIVGVVIVIGAAVFFIMKNKKPTA
jgi:hypothetical protein